MKDKIKELIEEKGLYDSIAITKDDVNLLEKYLMENEYVDNTVEYYCPNCQCDRVFKLYKSSVHKNDGLMRMMFPIQGEYEEPGLDEKYKSYLNKVYTVTYACSMNRSHTFLITLLLLEDRMIKIGQYPTVADVIKPEIKKYKALLGEERFKEFRRAVGLFANGVGIGSFVYLRRIIEGLIYDRFEEKKADMNINETDFSKLHFDEKIDCLKEYLPELLVENKNIYGIVSKGIHELSEEECIKFFPYIQDGIELILDELYVKKQQEEKARKFKNFVAETIGAL